MDQQPIIASPPPIDNTPEQHVVSHKKRVLLGSVLLLLLALGIVGSRFLAKDTTPFLPQPKPTTITGKEVATKTMSFIESSIQEDGTFKLIHACFMDKKACLYMPTEPRPSGKAIEALLALFDETQDTRYQNKADAAVTAYFNDCEQHPGNCHRNHTAYLAYFRKTGDERYKDAILRMEPNVFSEKTLDVHITSNDGGKLATLYEVTQDPSYITLVNQAAQAVLDGDLKTNPQNTLLYQEKETSVGKLDLRSINYLMLPAYRMTHDPAYLAYCEAFFQNAAILKNIDSYKALGSLDLLLAMDSLLQLADLTHNPTYKTQARDIAQLFVTKLWDSEYHKQFNGDFGFVENFRGTNNYKTTVNNGWLVLNFLKLKDETFALYE